MLVRAAFLFPLCLILLGCPPRSTESGGAEDEGLSPSQVVGALRAIHEGALAQVGSVRDRLEPGPVAELADDLLRGHRRSLVELEELAAELALQPDSSVLTLELRQDQAERVERLSGRSGRALARAFVEAQVDAHEQALELIDDRLEPTAEVPALRHLVHRTRASLAELLEAARRLQGDLAGGGL